jgi:hypothetical protein
MSAIKDVQPAVRQPASNEQNPFATFASQPPQGSLILYHLIINQAQGNVTITPPTGFTLIQDVGASADMRAAMYYKIAGAGESATITGHLSAGRPCVVFIENWTGHDPAAPIDVHTGQAAPTANPDTGLIQTSSVIAERHSAIFGIQYDEGSNLSNFTNGYTPLLSGRKDTGQANTSYTYALVDKDMPGPSVGYAGCSCAAPVLHDSCAIVVAVKEARTPITYARSGQLTSDSSAVSGYRGIGKAKAGTVIGPTAARGGRSIVTNKKNILVSFGALSAFRPAFYAKAARLISDNIKISSPYVHFRGATITRITTDFVHGIAGAQVGTTGAAPYQGTYTEFTPQVTDSHTASVYLRSTVPMRLRITVAATGQNIDTSATIDPLQNWTRVSLTPGAPLVAGTKYRFYIETAQAVATTFFIDAAQVEAGEAPSPFVVGTRPAGGGPVGDVIREQKPGGLLGVYVVVPGAPGIWATYQVLYDNHNDYTNVMDTKQTYKQVWINPGP